LLGSAVGFIFAFAAVLRAMNTMYAQLAARTRVIGALRAIGFKRRAVPTSLVMESVLLSLAAGVAGVLGASALSNLQFQPTTVKTLSEMTVRASLEPRLCAGLSRVRSRHGLRGRAAAGAARIDDTRRDEAPSSVRV
jgi:putative ABC transport system permease protein